MLAGLPGMGRADRKGPTLCTLYRGRGKEAPSIMLAKYLVPLPPTHRVRASYLPTLYSSCSGVIIHLSAISPAHALYPPPNATGWPWLVPLQPQSWLRLSRLMLSDRPRQVITSLICLDSLRLPTHCLPSTIPGYRPGPSRVRVQC